MVSDRGKLESIRRFSKAGLSMADIHVRRAHEEFEETGHSCFNEGWAAGYRAAMETMEKFIGDTIAEV